MMRQRITICLAILFLGPSILACSLQRHREPLTWHIILEIDKDVPDRDAATKRAVPVLENRLQALRVSSFDVHALDAPANGRIQVDLPNVPDRERLKRLLSVEGHLELTHVISPPNPAPARTYESQRDAEVSLGETAPPNRRVLPYSERSDPIPGNPAKAIAAKQHWVVVESPAIVDGADLRDATAHEAYSGSKDYNIWFTLKPEGAAKFAEWTGANINEYIGVVLNGEVRSIAFIKSQISDSAEISGRFNRQSAEDLALILKSGALPAVKIVEEGPNN
jgi:preprotein translocase subunit SecD